MPPISWHPTLFFLFGSCAFLTGLIWIIQLIHYPIFKWIKKEEFIPFHQFHSRTITWIVGPMMLIELVLSFLLAVQTRWSFFSLVNLAGVVVIWLVTAFISVPCHEKLGNGFEPQTHQKLVLTNWWRTGLWTARSAFLLWWIWSL